MFRFAKCTFWSFPPSCVLCLLKFHHQNYFQLLEKEQEKLKMTKEAKMKQNNDMVSDLVRQIIYLRKRIEIQELEHPQADQTHVHNLIKDKPNKTRRKIRDNRESKSVKQQFSI